MKSADLKLTSEITQFCTVPGLYRTWGGYAAGVILLSFWRNWIGLGMWLVLVPLAKWIYMLLFPRFSRFIGYGRVDDTLPNMASHAQSTRATVTCYGMLGCPFCPIVLERLQALQKEMGFTLTTVDVTLKPKILMNKGIRSIPVVEVGDARLIGNVTTEQLADLISHAGARELLHAS
jgi:glutaredoxin